MGGFNGSGVYDRFYRWATQATVNGGVISSAEMDTEHDGIATALSQCMTRDGQGSLSANMNINAFKFLNVADATLNNEFLSLKQFRNNDKVYYVTTGSSNAYVVTASPASVAYVTGQEWLIKPNFTNTTTTPTININGLGAKTLKDAQGKALRAGSIANGGFYNIVYDGTAFRVVNLTNNIIGTWTPTLYGETTAGTTTYEVQAGTYIIINDSLFRGWFKLDWTAITGTGGALIGGLPFTALNLNDIVRAPFIPSYHNSLSLGGDILTGYIQDGTDYIRLTLGGANTNCDMQSNMTQSGELYGMIEFII